jgi:hypothetical protein
MRRAEGAVPMPYQAQALEVLARWREVERALEAAVDGSPEADTLLAEAMRLRDEYQTLIVAALDADRPVPPPFPEGSVS